MIDEDEWQREDAEFEGILRERQHNSLPPGVLNARLVQIRARHRAIQQEIDAMLAAHPEAKNWKF